MDRMDVDVPMVMKRLIEIATSLQKSLMEERRHLTQAQILARISCYLAIRQEDDGDMSQEELSELELMCTWPKSTKQKTIGIRLFPTLRGLCSPVVSWEHEQAGAQTEKGIRAFAFATPKQREDCRHIAGFLKNGRCGAVENVPESRVAPLPKLQVTPEDYPRIVNKALYDTLRKYSKCLCADHRMPISKEHEAKLCLKSKVGLDAGLVAFDMHFGSAPYWEPNSDNFHWQQFRIHVSINRTRLKKVRVDDDMPIIRGLPSNQVSQQGQGDDHCTSLALTRTKLVLDTEFCELLNQRIGPAKLRLKVQDERLQRLHEADRTDQVLLPIPSVSLAQVLRRYDLSMKMKMSLAFTLAQSVWQYYDSDWMRTSWTPETIQFMLERSAQGNHPSVYIHKPCFYVRFQDSTECIPERFDIQNIVHKYPRLLGLGLLLVNIGRTSYLEGSSNRTQNEVEKRNDDYMTGWLTIERDQDWPDLGSADAARLRLRTVYKAVTQSCFDMNIFRDVPSSTNPRDESVEIEEHRKILYERVVWPLQKIIDEMGWTHSLGHIDAIKFDNAVLPNLTSSQNYHQIPFHQNRALSAAMQRLSGGSSLLQRQDSLAYHKAALFDDEMPVEGHTQQQRKAFSDWKDRFDQVYKHFIPDEPSISVPPVKIAVLDTGIDMENDYVEVHKDRVSGHDWLREPKSKRLNDLHGHGTHIAGLMLDLIPHSELYIAKVTDGEDTKPETLARAVDHAVEEGIDIISISIGFSQKVPGYRKFKLAIERAGSARVLIFAAASNGGGNNDRAYPARERDVFCIHSTDANGSRSKFSPTAEKYDFNFATIGEAVESFWPTHLCAEDEQAVRVKSGTSFATPIAASIAAFLLLYARVHLDTEQATGLKRYAAMESLLHEVSKGSRAKKDRDDYQYLFLSRHPDTFFGRAVEEINNSFRKCT